MWLQMHVDGVAECLMNMCCRRGRKMLSLMEIQNLVTLCPTDEEVKALKGFKGDPRKLGPVEQFMLRLADVPQARQRAAGLVFQAAFDERVKETYHRIRVFGEAVAQIRGADRLQRFLKAVLVLGNKMNGVTKKNKAGLVKAFTVNSLHQLQLVRACATCAAFAPPRTRARGALRVH